VGTRRSGLGLALAATLALLAMVAVGPRARLGEAPAPVDLPEDLDAYLGRSEQGVPDLRPGDQKEIVWVNGTPDRTPLSVVYLHGFSADRHEIDPVPRLVAESLGANLYYTRLSGHGRDGPALGGVRTSDWLRDTEEALAVGARIGERVVVVGTSTGGTLAVWGAARASRREALQALILISPNFQPKNRASRLLLWPWGGLVSRIVVGPERCFEPANHEQARHWTPCYPTRALLPMMALVEAVRTMDVGEIRTPVLILHGEDDQVVDLAETRRVFRDLGSPLKRIYGVPEADDREHHVLAGRILSPRATGIVTRRIVAFVKETS
jgi:alpha-beta hydrolase superfamily lysophospholipase